MKIKLLPSSFAPDGTASERQHTTCFVIDGRVAIDAGSLGQAAELTHRENVRDIIISHAHLDHIGGLPLFVDDLFATLTEPITVHASRHVIDVLERHIFNWSVYPRFSEISNDHGRVLEYSELQPFRDNQVKHLTVFPIEVNHNVPSTGFIVSDAASRIAITGDTASMEGFWETVNEQAGLDALFVECAFPDHLAELAAISHHLTPTGLSSEIKKFAHKECPIYVVNVKPMYRDQVIAEISKYAMSNVEVFEVGREYTF